MRQVLIETQLFSPKAVRLTEGTNPGGNILVEGVLATVEAAQKEADELSDIFPNSEFYVESSYSEREPVTVTV